ncbi:MAG: dTMP kinase [Angustibacter sp.]
MRRPTRIVAVLGVDGSGKTTQAQLLAAWLQDQGVPARAFKNPGGRLRLDRLAHRLGRGDARQLLSSRGFLVVEALVRGLAISRALLLAWLTGQVAVMDRYTSCQYAVLRARSDPGERAVRVAYRLFPTPDVTCFLAVPPAVAQQRVAARGRDVEDIAHLAALDAGYRSLPEFGTFAVVAARGQVSDVQQALRGVVAPALTCRPRSGPSDEQLSAVGERARTTEQVQCYDC